MWSDKELETRINKAVDWIREKVNEAKAEGVVVGVSGGVDSAVVAGLCKRAFPDHAVGVIMPAHSNPVDREDALLTANALGLEIIEIELSQVHTQVMNQVGKYPKLKTGHTQMAQGNLKARLRMATLYTIANSVNYLVVGTDNAPESYTGYFTKYGDGGVDILPISSLTKTEVRAWAKVLGLPEKIVNRVPTAGLWQGQTDEGEMGISYDLIDRYLLGGDVSPEVAETIERMHRISEHKRHTPPAFELPKLERLD